MLAELKHSIRIHALVMQGPTPELAVYLIKVIDFLEDTDQTRREAEMAALSYKLIESVALHIQRSIDDRLRKLAAEGKPVPLQVQVRGDHLLVVVGQTRNLPDRIVAKNAVLKEVAECLRALAAHTGSKYPDITDSVGRIL